MSNDSGGTATATAAATAAVDPKRWLALAVIAIAQLMVVLDATDREHRPALGPGGAGHLRRRPAVDRHRLHPGLRWPAAARRPDRRLLRPQADLHHRPARLRRRLRARRRRADAASCSPPAPCRARSRALLAPGRAVADHGDLHRAPRSGPRRSASSARSPAAAPRSACISRRRAHRVRLLALVPAGQHPDRDHRRARGLPLRQESRADGRHPLRHPGCGAGHRRPGRARLRLHQGRPTDGWGSGSTARLAVAAASCCSPRSCSSEPRAEHPLLPLRIVLRPQPGRLLPGRRSWSVPGLFGDVPVPDLLPAGDARLLGAQGGFAFLPFSARHHRRAPASPRSCCPGSGRGVMAVGGCPGHRRRCSG